MIFLDHLDSVAARGQFVLIIPSTPLGQLGGALGQFIFWHGALAHIDAPHWKANCQLIYNLMYMSLFDRLKLLFLHMISTSFVLCLDSLLQS